MPLDDLTGTMSFSFHVVQPVDSRQAAGPRGLAATVLVSVRLCSCWSPSRGPEQSRRGRCRPRDLHRGLGEHGQFRRVRPEDSFRGWLWTVTRNKVRDHLRRAKGQVRAQGGTRSAQAELVQVPERPSDEAEGTPLGTWLEQRALDMIRAEFEDRTWAAFWHATVDDRTAAEIAADLGMSKEAVRQAKYRVLRRLREELDGLLDD